VTHEGARELLAKTHPFPCSYTIKAIGRAVDDFAGRTVAAAQGVMARAAAVRFSTRTTPDGNHVAVTLDVEVADPDEVIRVYRALQVVDGLRFLI
jgi:putative lipoic acid-binding regulatory protein